MKTWVFKFTEEIRAPKKFEYFLHDGLPYQASVDYIDKQKLPILSLTVCDSDPLEPIREVYERVKHLDQLLGDPAWCHDDMGYCTAGELYRAMKEAMKRCQPK